MDLGSMGFIRRRIINALDGQINNMSSSPSTRNSMARGSEETKSGADGKSWVSSYTFLSSRKVP